VFSARTRLVLLKRTAQPGADRRLARAFTHRPRRWCETLLVAELLDRGA
jgi:hypothetical protein